MIFYLFCAIFALTAASYMLGRRRAVNLADFDALTLHSRPSYHGAFVAVWAGLPSLILVLLWLLFQGPVVDSLLVASLPDSRIADLDGARIDLLVSEIKAIARGRVFGEPDEHVIAAAERYASWQQIARWAMVASAIALLLFGAATARRRLSTRFRARQGVERVMDGLMIFCSLVAILTTVGIVSSLLFEAYRFFQHVPVTEFFFGLRWEPQIAIREDQVAGQGAFGAVPVFAGTLLIAVIAMLVAVPVGLLSAVYLAEYASSRFRAVIKPILEILAGIPTVVYGFFAVLTVAPAMRQFGATIGLEVAPNSALTAGAVMGIMIIPFVSSLSDDALNAVPQSMREGSYGLGATKAETILQVLLPAALPGIMGGVLLAASRAIGETMIVVMAAGLIANMTANPLEGVTTVTVQIVSLLIGDTAFDSPKTLAAFALGLVLFVATLCLNVVALRIVQKYRERYE
ncbi:MAG: phosphate ABC transporter permease subunit PstC [Hyphomicrobiales bacterium]